MPLDVGKKSNKLPIYLIMSNFYTYLLAWNLTGKGYVEHPSNA